MLMSFTPRVRDPGPMTSTPNKPFIPIRLTNGTPNGNHSPVSEPSGRENGGSLSPPTSKPSPCSTGVEDEGIEEHSSTGVKMDVDKSPESSEANAGHNLAGYRTIQNQLDEEPNDLRRRLLSALTDIIPHRNKLSVRLLVNYKIDDKDSECLVIDETLCRRPTNGISGSHPSSAATSLGTEIAEPIMNHISHAEADDHIPCKIKKRGRGPLDSNVLDLSVHSDGEDNGHTRSVKNCKESLYDASEIKTNSKVQISSSSEVKIQPELVVAKVTKAGTEGNMVNPTISLPSSIGVKTEGNGTQNGPAVITTSGLPFVDTSLLALLPLLQQQQQQQQVQLQQQQHQQQQLQQRLWASQKIQPIPQGLNSNPVSNPTEIAENVLLRELQALIQANSANSQANTPSVNIRSTEALSSIMNNTTATLLTSSASPSVSTPSLVGFPLFNPFTTDQMTAVQALLPSPSLLSTSLSTPNFTSLNLGSATLLNLKDKTTGLETVGIMPAGKTLPQPVANLLSQINIPQSNSLSFRTLSTLSHLFNPGNSDSSLNSSTISNNSNNKSIISNAQGLNVGLNLPAAVSLEDGSAKSEDIVTPLMTSANNNAPSLSFPTPTSDQTMGNSNSPVQSMSVDGGGVLSNGSYNSNQFMFGRRLAHSRRFTCNQCRKNFGSLAELNRHTLEAHNSFKCTICSAHFTQRSNLQRHSLKHVGFKPFTCNLCRKEYYRKDHLVRHIEVTHPNHDPKMNITVHLTSSECLDYLDRIHAGKQTPSPDNMEIQGPALGDCMQDGEEEQPLKIEESELNSGEANIEPNMDSNSENQVAESV
ncbi:unnamed protein product [Calicophoron daubneyi]|uniref:C2H2-type domain-containing protein n=1 Tax=Calicophoron daubneyi TaxID=300641 RepID=A0AAV2TTT2_CALDB